MSNSYYDLNANRACRAFRRLTVVAADERVIIVGFLAFQVSRLRRGNTKLLGW